VEKSRHSGDKFWLYIVTEAASDAQQLNHIQNPTTQFWLSEDIFATGFILHEDIWQERAANAPDV